MAFNQRVIRNFVLSCLCAFQIFGFFASAGYQCEALFTTTIETPLKIPPLKGFKNELDFSDFSRQNFRIERDGSLYDLSGSKEVLVGRLKVLHADYLFKWTTKEFKSEIMKSAGIDQAKMNIILQADPQGSGLGYYVSVSPFDSAGMGDVLIAFKVNKPIVVFELDPRIDQRDSTVNSINFAKRLAASGVAGFRTGTVLETWLSVINHHFLNSAHELSGTELDRVLLASKSNVQQDQERFEKFFNIHRKRISREMKKSVALKIFLQRELTSDDVIWAFRNFDSLTSLHRRHVFKHLKIILERTKDMSELVGILDQVSRSSYILKNHLREIGDIYDDHGVAELTKVKMATMDIYDFETVAQLKERIGDERSLQFQKMFDFASHYESVVNSGKGFGQRSRIKTLNDFFNFADEAFAGYFEPKIKTKSKTREAPRKIKLIGHQWASLPAEKVIRALLQKTESFVEPSERITDVMIPDSLSEIYQCLLFSNLFKEKNAVLSRLFILVIGFRSHGWLISSRGLTLPSLTSHEFLTEIEWASQLWLGAILKQWIIGSPSTDEFVERSSQAANYLSSRFANNGL